MKTLLIIAALTFTLAADRCPADEADDDGDPNPAVGAVVKVVKTDTGYVLLRNGRPYIIKGAGGRARMAQLKEAGGNSLRTWRPDHLRHSLDQAHTLGLTMTVGIWMGHERHGHRYSDPAFIQQMHDDARAAVLELKDHPAVLMWGIGNEMEGDGGNVKVWQTINDIARMIKSIDPNHPCMTVIAGVGQGKVRRLVKHCPEIDVVGVNAYGDLSRIPTQLAEQGWDKPYVITEFGPYGWWQSKKTSWGAEFEPTSTEKAATYLTSYAAAVLSQPHRCFGAYAFLWGDKQEHTHTWFGMFLPTGERTAAVDAMTKVWTGQWPENRAPEIHGLQVTPANATTARADDGSPEDAEQIHPPGARLICRVNARDPNGDPLTIKWEVRAESTDKRHGGDPEAVPPSFPSAVVHAAGDSATIVLPMEKQGYRVFVYVFDQDRYAATANVPVLVR